jgi:hypothetical protein
MSIIPLDIQRRCERRWAARFEVSEPNKASIPPISSPRSPLRGIAPANEAIYPAPRSNPETKRHVSWALHPERGIA